MEPQRHEMRCNHLLSLPQELLQLIFKDVPGKLALWSTCKAIATALTSCCDTIILKRCWLHGNGPRQEVARAFAAFPKAQRLVVNFRHDGKHSLSAAPACSCDAPTDTADCAFPCAQTCSPSHSDENLLVEILSTLRGSSISSLALLHLSCSPPLPSGLTHLAPTLTQLEITDVSYSTAVDQGAFNVLIRERHAICSRSGATIALAVTLPQLRRLSLASAVFTVSSVATLCRLTKLESLSLVGCMECPGSVQQAAETHRGLLQALQGLQQLRLPMALAAADTGFLDEDDDHLGNDRFGSFGGERDMYSWEAYGEDALDSAASGSIGPLLAGLLSAQLPYSGGSWRSALHAMWQPGGGCRAAGGLPAFPAFISPASATAPRHSGEADGSINKILFHSGGVAGPGAADGVNSACNDKTTAVDTATVARATAAVYGSWVRPSTPTRLQEQSPFAVGFVFPPHLEDLTIPLCALNRPVFEAVCNTFSYCAADESRSNSGSAGAAVYGACVRQRGSHHDDGACGSTTASATGARCCCFRISSLRRLHIPTLAGYSHWEGSFLSSLRDFEQLGRLAGLELLHLSLDISALGTSPAGMRAGFQNLCKLRSLRELRITEAQQPTCFSVRKRSAVYRALTRRGFNVPAELQPDSDLCGPTLHQLHHQWPHLQTLQFFSEMVVRSGGGRLVVPSGLKDVDLLPPPCACCTAPCLMAAPQPSVGRWGRGDPRWISAHPPPEVSAHPSDELMSVATRTQTAGTAVMATI